MAAFLAASVIAINAADPLSNQTVTATPAHTRPTIIYVTDFRLDPSQVEQNKERLGGGPLGGPGPLGGKLRKTKEPADERRQLARTLSDSIIQHLKRTGFRAELLPNVSVDYKPDEAGGRLQFLRGTSELPEDGWFVTGWFEKVEQGSAAVQATAGFGAGSGHAAADVAVSDLAGDPTEAFLVMGSGSRTRRMPGGLITKSPYVMTAKFLVNRHQGTEKDVKDLGRQIASSLTDYIEQLGKSGQAGNR